MNEFRINVLNIMDAGRTIGERDRLFWDVMEEIVNLFPIIDTEKYHPWKYWENSSEVDLTLTSRREERTSICYKSYERSVFLQVVRDLLVELEKIGSKDAKKYIKVLNRILEQNICNERREEVALMVQEMKKLRNLIKTFLKNADPNMQAILNTLLGILQSFQEVKNSYSVLGTFRRRQGNYEKSEITLHTEEIEKKGGSIAEEYTRVLLHEVFHWVHFNCVYAEKRSICAWDGEKGDWNRTCVVEGLARYIEYLYLVSVYGNKTAENMILSELNNADYPEFPYAAVRKLISDPGRSDKVFEASIYGDWQKAFAILDK